MTTTFEESIAEKLKNLRKENNYTQKQIADYLEIDQSHLSNIEHGKRNISIDMVEKLCNLYNCSLEYLLGETDTYKKTKIAFRGNKNNNDINLIAKMNEIMKNLEFLRKCDD